MILQLKKYIHNTEKIRALSTPSLEKSDLPGQYEEILRRNFNEIGMLAKENRDILDDVLFPMLKEKRVLNRKEIKTMMSIYDELIYGGAMENLDVPLGNIISGYLWEMVADSEDVELMLQICDMHATSCYLMMNYSKRTFPFSDECEHFRTEGKSMCDILLSYLEYDKWITLPSPESRKLILDLAVYKSSFYEGIVNDPEQNEEELEILRRASAVAGDERYRDGLTKEQWSVYRQRVNEYYGLLLESGNQRGFTYVQCVEIHRHMEELMQQWETEPEGWKEPSSYGTDLLCYYRSAYFVGKLSSHDYKQKLYDVYQGRSDHSFSLDDVFINLLLPLEYIKLDKRNRMSEYEAALLEQVYHNANNYVFQLPNSGSLIYVIEYLVQLLENFRELPGGITFEEICLNSLGALHPPTYIHSKMVAAVTRCLCKHLLRISPELFFDFLGGESDAARVREKRGEILDFAYHAALCHDFGKLAIIDTVFVYGRNILDCEFSQIKSHPELGAMMLEKNASTARYANVAKGHHRWYNDAAGYPAAMETVSLPEKVMIDLVCCADCMDAATDSAGRSYNKGKSLEEFVSEVEAGAGTRYAPFLPELLRREEVFADLTYLLRETRNLIYRDTFVMLRRLQLLGTDTDL